LFEPFAATHHTSELGGPQVNAVSLSNTVVSAGHTEVVQVTATFVGANVALRTETAVVAALQNNIKR